MIALGKEHRQRPRRDERSGRLSGKEADGIVAAGRWSLCYSHKAQREAFQQGESGEEFDVPKNVKEDKVEEIIILIWGEASHSLGFLGIAMIKVLSASFQVTLMGIYGLTLYQSTFKRKTQDSSRAYDES